MTRNNLKKARVLNGCKSSMVEKSLRWDQLIWGSGSMRLLVPILADQRAAGPEAERGYESQGQSSVTHFLTSGSQHSYYHQQLWAKFSNTRTSPWRVFHIQTLISYFMKWRDSEKYRPGIFNTWLSKFKCIDNYLVVGEEKVSKRSIHEILIGYRHGYYHFYLYSFGQN